MLFQITYTNHFKALQLYLFGLAILGAVLYFVDFQEAFVIGCSSVLIVWTIPVAYLHLEYYFHNRCMVIDINEDSIVLVHRGKSRRYLKSELRRIVVYKSGSLDKGIPYLPMEQYHFAKVIAENGDIIVVTCLMLPNVEKILRKVRGVPIEIKKTLFPALGLYLTPRHK